MSIETGSCEPDDSQVFLVRLWAGEVANLDEGESMESIRIRVQGKVTHLLSGKGSNFKDWPNLVDLLIGMMPSANPIGDSRPGNTP
jgi:hypothetical protein